MDDSLRATTADSLEQRPVHGLRESEFIAMMSMVSATIALSIDTVLPGFDQIRAEFGMAPNDNSVSWIVTSFLLGIAAGQLFWGPITDRFGRKRAMYASLFLFAVGAFGATLAGSFTALIIGRVVWGLGAAGPRAIIMAIIRDTYEGNAMARIASLVTAVFLIVPILAPSVGEGLIAIGDWRWTFGISVVAAALLALWLVRLNETSAVGDRRSLQIGPLLDATRQVLTNRFVMFYLVAQVATYGAFFPWLGSSEIIIGEIYERSDQFALLFGANAIVMGLAIWGASHLVTRFGAQPYVKVLCSVTVVVAAGATMFTVLSSGVPEFWTFYAVVCVLTALNAMLSPVLASEALQPMGHIAGTATAITGALVFALGALLGGLIDAAISDTVSPFVLGYLIYGVVGLAAVLAAHMANAGSGDVAAQIASPSGAGRPNR